jgi:hypothetical protein
MEVCRAMGSAGLRAMKRGRPSGIRREGWQAAQIVHAIFDACPAQMKLPYYVATHIGASLKKRLKEQGVEGIQGDLAATNRAVVTVSEALIEREPWAGENSGKGPPGYIFQRAAGELWRSRFDEMNNLVVINNGHRDYRYAAEKHARKLRYICRLFS